MSKVHFACVGCGKCCNTSPQLSLTEIVKYWSVFPMRLDIQTAIGEHGAHWSDYANAQLAQHESLGGVAMVDARWKGVIRLVGDPFAQSGIGKCSQLMNNGHCGIYADRPSVCHLVPLSLVLPEAYQHVALESLRQHAEMANWDCEMGDDAPLLWENGEVVSTEYRAAFENAVEVNSDGDMQRRLLSHIGIDARGLPHFAALKMQKLGVFAPLSSFLECFSDLFDDPREAANTQLALIRAEIAENIKRKRPQDKPYTEELRDHEKAWVKYLRK